MYLRIGTIHCFHLGFLLCLLNNLNWVEFCWFCFVYFCVCFITEGSYTISICSTVIAFVQVFRWQQGCITSQSISVSTDRNIFPLAFHSLLQNLSFLPIFYLPFKKFYSLANLETLIYDVFITDTALHLILSVAHWENYWGRRLLGQIWVSSIWGQIALSFYKPLVLPGHKMNVTMLVFQRTCWDFWFTSLILVY